MNKLSKDNLIWGAKVLALLLATMFAIISNAAVWNAAVAGAADKFQVWVSILNFVMELAAIGYASKHAGLKAPKTTVEDNK